MVFINNCLGQMTSWIQPYYSEIALIILATLLVIYGDLLNKHIKRMVHSYHFLIRTLVFVLVCAFGYGLVVVYLSPYVKELILFIPYLYRGLSLFLLFLLLGYLAENRRYI